MSLQPEPWLQSWTTPLLRRHPEIEQVFLLGKEARGPFGQKPNYSLLFYAGYDRALDLLTSLAREENEFRCAEGILHLYVENYGATFCGIWGGALIPNDLNNSWVEEVDYKLWIEISSRSRPLSERLRLPEERRQGERRHASITEGFDIDADPTRDELSPVFVENFSIENSHAAVQNGDSNRAQRRERSDRRRDMWDWMPLLDN